MNKFLGVAVVLSVICIVDVYSAYTFGGKGYGTSGLSGNDYTGGLYKGYGGLSGGLGHISGGYGGYGGKGIPILQIPIVPYKGVRIGKGVAKGFGKGIGTGKGIKGIF
ncbi:hypothetical protein CHS0354_010820 [Potamilus streckersoni]|uniref:Uncharacterized protein n=1 Tax=Potamilus streckersoni TaxID=2493646 RepID=A0AAE0W9M2_9BIVA|nr:hypothetical protein CHS0354_010820 [Potamilus streckersoni]